MNKWIYTIVMTFAIAVLLTVTNGRFATVAQVEAGNGNGSPKTTDTPTPTTSSFSITDISAHCDGTGTVSYIGTIPNGGIILTLYDQHLGNGNGFVISDPVISTTITSGSSPVSYSLNVSGWTGGPHYRVDSNFNTKSESLYCNSTPTPTQTPTPTVTVTVTPTQTPTATPTQGVTPTPTTDPCANNACVTITPTVTDTPTPTPTIAPTDTPVPGPTATPVPCTSNCGGSNNTPSNPPTQAVLGASTMADTGTFTDNMMNILMTLGMISLVAGATKYAKAKKS